MQTGAMGVITRGFSSAGPVTREQETGHGGGLKSGIKTRKKRRKDVMVKEHKRKAEVETITVKEQVT